MLELAYSYRPEEMRAIRQRLVREHVLIVPAPLKLLLALASAQLVLWILPIGLNVFLSVVCLLILIRLQQTVYGVKPSPVWDRAFRVRIAPDYLELESELGWERYAWSAFDELTEDALGWQLLRAYPTVIVVPARCLNEAPNRDEFRRLASEYFHASRGKTAAPLPPLAVAEPASGRVFQYEFQWTLAEAKMCMAPGPMQDYAERESDGIRFQFGVRAAVGVASLLIVLACCLAAYLGQRALEDSWLRVGIGSGLGFLVPLFVWVGLVLLESQRLLARNALLLVDRVQRARIDARGLLRWTEGEQGFTHWKGISKILFNDHLVSFLHLTGSHSHLLPRRVIAEEEFDQLLDYASARMTAVHEQHAQETAGDALKLPPVRESGNPYQPPMT